MQFHNNLHPGAKSPDLILTIFNPNSDQIILELINIPDPEFDNGVYHMVYIVY
jgi:hypothetical protein